MTVRGSRSRAAVALRLDGVGKSFGRIAALHPSSLEIQPGKLVALLGPSGCGKTTTLRLIAGFELPDVGRVLIDGADVTDLPPNRRNLGMVFQNYSLFPHMTVGENIAFGLKMARIEKSAIAGHVHAALDLVRLPGYDDRFAHQLSGGQQQRVALARSLVTNPSVLLLDEPLGALDKNLRESMQFELRQLQQRLEITTILVTHDQEEALTMSDLVVVMNEGRILQIGSPIAVYERPRTRFVSEFLGTANLFPSRVIRREGDRMWRLALHLDDAAVEYTAMSEATLAPDQEMLAAIRPEKILFAPTVENGDGVPATVLDRVFRGSYHAYQARVPGRSDPVFVYQQARLADGDGVVAVGAAVRLQGRPENVILLAGEE